jgi:protoporphyrinogen oxidase
MAFNVIVGAGLTGLAAAAAMVRNGVIPLVIEKDDTFGGLAKSFQFDGQVFDAGVHFFRWPSDLELRRFLETILQDLRAKNIRFVLNLKNRKISPQPGFVNFIKYPIGLKIGLLKRRSKATGDLSLLSEKLKSGYGDWLYNNFFEGYLEKKIPILNKENVHSDWWSNKNQRDEFNEFILPDKSHDPEIKSAHRNVKSMLRSLVSGHNNPAYYHPGGIGEIANRLESYISRNGVKILFNTEIEYIKRDISDTIVIKISGGDEIQCRNLVWTGNIVGLAGLLGIPWPGELKFLDTILVLLVIKRDSPGLSKNLFEYCASGDIIFSRVYYNDYFLEKNNIYGICVEISSNAYTGMLSDAEIINKTIAGLRKIGSIDIDEEKIVNAKIHVIRGSHPVYPVNYRALVEKFNMYVKKYANIFLAGRSGSFNNLSMPRAMTMGWKIGVFCSKD